MRVPRFYLEHFWLGTVSFILLTTLVALLFSSAGLQPGNALVSILIGAIGTILIVRRSHPIHAESLPPDNWLWKSAAAICFLLFTFRAFLWLIFLKDDRIAVLSRNNLGDLSLHIQYIRFFSSGAPLWPVNPIHAHSTIGYPFGVDYFNAILDSCGVSLWNSLIVTGVVCSLATGVALYRWGRAFGVAGFLFNGGTIGFAFLTTGKWEDYQQMVDWKSIPLALFVTQRGFLYALPAGLLLLVHWRNLQSGKTTERQIPFWLEWLIYATMPLFHIHTFLFLSVMLGGIILFGKERRHFLILVLAALIPASGLMWFLTDGFHAGNSFAWMPGWSQPAGFSPVYWLKNFGALPFFIVWLIWSLARQRDKTALVLVGSAAFMFIATLLFKFAPWEWDNTKLMMWSYLVFLPFLWKILLENTHVGMRVTSCFLLFASGFISLWSGLGPQEKGYEIASQPVVLSVAKTVEKIPILEIFATAPEYAHPLALAGRRMALSYHGHMIGHGLSYQSENLAMNRLMNGGDDWQQAAKELGAHYIYWGADEERTWPASRKPWISSAELVAAESWGEIYRITP